MRRSGGGELNGLGDERRGGVMNDDDAGCG